jgi:hypothetical protein
LLVGAFDPSAWTGLVFCLSPGQGFAFRVAVEIGDERFDGYDFLDIISEVGPCSPDGSYARLAIDHATSPTNSPDSDPAIAFEWSKVDERRCVGRIVTPLACLLEIRAYYPWDWCGSWATSCPAAGASGDEVTILGVAEPSNQELRMALQRDVCDHEHRLSTDVSIESDECVARFSMRPGNSLYFETEVSSDTTLPAPARDHCIDKVETIRQLKQAEQSYGSTRVTVDRHWRGLGASITNNLHWMVSLKPEDGTRYTPAGRRWIFPRDGGGIDHWTIFCWDAFFNALELAVESPVLARDTLWSVLDTQYENGNVPNWRGRFFGTRDRSQPPIGSFVALKLFLRSGDRETLERAFPILNNWSEWWRAPKGAGYRRDGNVNGLFEWGCDLGLLRPSPAPWENDASPHQFAAWESGQDDLPNWDAATWVSETETFDLESVDLNSLIALDLECLSRIAEILGLDDAAEKCTTRYESISRAMNEHLWDEDRGMYMDRFWDGRRSTRMAASNFYPLVAGIAPPDRAERMIDTLLDETKFWGKFVLPSISRDDPAFGDQQYWRGTIWPPTNYLVYQGLRRYNFDLVAAELAKRSVDLFLGSWTRSQLCRENYDGRTGEGGGQKYQSWGPLFALTGIEEFIDVTPWDGLRMGSLSPPGTTTLDRIRICARTWRVTLSASGLRVSVDGDDLLTSTRPIVLRHVKLSSNEVSAETHSEEKTTVRFALGSADLSTILDGTEFISPASAVELPAGVHTISVRAIT